MPQINKPLNVQQLRSILDKDNRLEVTIVVSLDELIDNDIEDLNDLCEERIVENGILADIRYKVVGHVPSKDQSSGDVLLQVNAEVDKSGYADDEDRPSYYSHEAHGTDRVTDFVNEGGVVTDNERQVMDRDDIVERVGRQINYMDGKELIEFCQTNFGGENHKYDEATDSVSFDLE